MNVNRRSFIASMSAIMVTGLAGCSGVQKDINLTADPVGLSNSTIQSLDLELTEYISDSQTQEIATSSEGEPINVNFKLNILIYNSQIQEEQSNLAFVSTGSHEIVGQEVNPVSQVTPKQIIQNVTSIEDQSQIEDLGSVPLTHSEYGELEVQKYRTTIERVGEDISLINYGFTDKINETLILGIGSHLEGNTQREESIKEGLASFEVPTNAVEGKEPTDLADSTLSGVTNVDDIDMEELPF